jgi:tryptophanyl-tRNA synthetase
MKPVILTGIRANNDLTIGNYLGALLPIVDMAKKRAGDYQVNLFVPDLHSFTTPIDHSKLQEQILQNLRVFVTAGLPIDHDDVHIYRQSYIPAHSELTWILDCFTGFGEMHRMTQFKDKSGLTKNNAKIVASVKEAEAIADELAKKEKEGTLNHELPSRLIDILMEQSSLIVNNVNPPVSLGLFNYPVLMAADIILYNAQYVPVGDDQTQHLEFTRDIAERLNNQFGDLFTVPLPVPKQHEFFGKDQGLRIKDLIDPTKKMSKSDETGRGVIFMSDQPEVAAKKIMGATTDSFGEIKFDTRERPGISNLLQILALLGGRDQKEVIAEWEGKTSYGDLKKAVAEVVKNFLQDFHSKLATVDDQAILTKLQDSEKQMNEIANATLLRAQQAVGLRAKS